MSTAKRQVVDFYESTRWEYDFFWDDEIAHYGFGGLLESHPQRLKNSNEYYTRRLDVGPDDRVLVVGCGKGGLCIHLARAVGCSVVGLDMSEAHIQRARENAERRNVDVTFVRGDFMELPFAPDSFDRYVGIETMCYATDTDVLLAECARVLADGGRLVCGDGWRGKEAFNRVEQKIWDTTLDGWVLQHRPTPDQFAAALEEHGFAPDFSDNTGDVRSSSLRLFVLGILGVPLMSIRYALGRSERWSVKQAVTLLTQFVVFNTGMGCHGDFAADVR